ncbi:MAG: SDR family oxidoreductase [Deltaproteobacteria bacterium]|nr:SDR family oxidoreductase [Deltaproteobacteria bacterium]
MSLTPQSILMTGFPGFIAKRLVSEMIRASAPRFIFLVQHQQVFAAKKLCDALELQYPSFANRWTIAAGDLRAPGLGLTPEAHTLIRETVDSVWHLAAIYDLAVSAALAYEVNVEGTLRVLDLCEELPLLKRLIYVSTCYVAGDRQGTAYEDELDLGQGFKNHYESTKCWAEKHVQRRWERIPTVVLRPSIVVGDSTTGETVKGDGPYFIMQLLMRLPSWLPMVNVGQGLAAANVVPVDWLVDASLRLSEHPDAAGKVFHLADPNPPSSREVLDQLTQILGRAAVLGHAPETWAQKLLAQRHVQRLTRIPPEVFVYFNHPISFDTNNTAELLAPITAPCPQLSSYLPRLVSYAQEHPEIFKGATL